jgi:atypical dual specificity phosphatase
MVVHGHRVPMTLVAPLVFAVLAGGCGKSMDREAMPGFSWVIDGELAGMPRPGGVRPLEADLRFIADQGVDLLVSLTETPTDEQALTAAGITLLHLPVVDFTAPTQEQLAEFVSRAGEVIGRGDSVGVHCAGGKGRTGTFLAAFFVSRGMTADQAIEEVRRLRPGSIETAEQERAVEQYESGLVNDEGARTK